MRNATVKITSFSKDGFGAGESPRADGNIDKVEVPFTAPGDEVEATLFRKRKGLYQARLESVSTPSPLRVAPRCVHFGTCGGCRWQHLSYSKQLDMKESTVHQAFEPILQPGTDVHPIIGCEEPWYYRNKMEFSFSSNKAGDRFLGLMMQGGNQRVVQLQECHLVSSWFVDALKATRSWWEASGLLAYHPRRNEGSLRTLIVREGLHTGDRMAMLTVSGNPDFALDKAQINSWVEAMKAAITPTASGATLSLFLRIQQIAKGSPTSFYEIHLNGLDHIREKLHLSGHAEPLQCKISPSAFFQPCTKQAEKLYSRALELAGLQPDMVVFDLFCGTGTLGLASARKVRHVVGIELSHEAILDARSNAAQNDITNIEFYPGDVAKVLAQLGESHPDLKPDLVIVDPPRAGLGEKAIAHLKAIAAPNILYVSCNPRTQATDIAELLSAGYELEAIHPVDQFPQTIHIENIAVLRRRNPS
ncbi:MAG: 23S rRNA (uracil(1939)-C(5))-methyltransferase RlmD [Chlamydiales bacterium]|nr:23S rRNA (uracil(1939)-C(5))-methyltransferase RlmD [Chlamydiales bacterium]